VSHQQSYSSLASSEELLRFLTVAIGSCFNLSFLGAVELHPGKVCVRVSSHVNERTDFHPHWNATFTNSGIKQCKLIVLWSKVAERGLTQQAEAGRDWPALQREMEIAGHKKYFLAHL